MGQAVLEEYLVEEPFRPIRMVLLSGDRLIIKRRSEALVTGLAFYLGRSTEDERVPGYHRVVSLSNIAYVERAEALPLIGRRRS
jgi:hypothetical protein